MAVGVLLGAFQELESISLSKEEQRASLGAYLSGKDVFTLRPAGFNSLIYEVALPVALSYYIIWFVDLIG